VPLSVLPSLRFDFPQALRKERIGFRYLILRTSGRCQLIATEEKNAQPARIEGIQDAIGAAFVLHTQFAHVRKGRALTRIRIGTCQTRTGLL
jgi:hypothetical protein